MEDPLANDPRVERALRYTKLESRDRAFTTRRFLDRTGAYREGMTPRYLTADEAMELEESDFG